jgi:hypothetical protein
MVDAPTHRKLVCILHRPMVDAPTHQKLRLYYTLNYIVLLSCIVHVDTLFIYLVKLKFWLCGKESTCCLLTTRTPLSKRKFALGHGVAWCFSEFKNLFSKFQKYQNKCTSSQQCTLWAPKFSMWNTLYSRLSKNVKF